MDTGASDHVTFDLTLFISKTTLPLPTQVTLPDGTLGIVRQIGQISLTSTWTLKNVLNVPGFKYNVLSVNKCLKDNNLYITIFPNECYF